MRTFIVLLLILSGTVLSAQEKKSMERKVNKTEEEWKEILTPQQYYVLREKGTDRPGNGGYTKHFEKGTYHCAACDAQLFESGTKYESHCGWPSFDDAIKGSVEYVLDKSHGMIRTEIICTSCGGHLGHVFDDGPRDTTGKRYCVNTSSIRFEKSDL
ncbi:peptide-methionine (R)-S-oxide reductase MsrB [Lutimonas saemankumensis]|uniref:peptide-methionine (R)-S-oxide reductase MsrB n=1 Tax=Lutimonas saemankumensis TaxID=483016 RepID=UPI001CD1DFA6|nr:peptide-methionine (R)-S-oxide reductase MsrB [Lutimonas saemankumensis]MCA0932343.1 peptide-methionine (R)-S-oxide reductase MsrB [Lutimonas saemankumensis]